MDSSNNSLYGNRILNNQRGIWIHDSSDNSIYHNCFINNTIHAFVESLPNEWDDGFPSGGNFWDDYSEKYPEAQEIADSGIWDTPYVIDQDNIDNYPLIPELPSFVVLPVFMLASLLATLVYKSRKSEVHLSSG